MTKNDGGPVHPQFSVRWTIGGDPILTDVQGGLSLRDYFAAQYLAGRVARPMDPPLIADEVAHDAYTFADALIAGRDKERD